MKKNILFLSFFSLFTILLIAIFLFKYVKPAYADCDMQYCTESNCTEARCDTCTFCLQCNNAYCIPSTCSERQCWGCGFCISPGGCDNAFCNPPDCSYPRCNTCSYCTSPPSSLCCATNDDCGFQEVCTGYSYLCSQAGRRVCEPGIPTSGDECSGPGDPVCGNDLECRYVMGEWRCMTPIAPPPASGTNLLCEGGTGINTAIGCIPIDQQGFTRTLLIWAGGIAGGIAFVLMIYAGFMIITSAGNPQRLQAGKELLTAAIMGLLLLLFGAYLLRLIGFTILRIPGFT